MNWLFGFENRINRAKYCIAILIYLIPYAICLLILQESVALGITLTILVAFLMAMPAAKRLHDLNHSGWWQLLGLVPFVQFGLGIYMIFWRGTSGSNRFGADPLGEENTNSHSLPVQQVMQRVGSHYVPESTKNFDAQSSTPAAVSKIEQANIPVRPPEAQRPSTYGQLKIESYDTATNSTGVSEASLEDYAYEVVAMELENNTQKKGLWTRLYAECDGNEKTMKVRYIQLRTVQVIAAENARIDEETLRITALREQEENERISQFGERQLKQHHIANGQFGQIEIPHDAGQFMRAIVLGDQQLVQDFLERDVSYLAVLGDCGNTPLHIAIVEENSQIALLLIEYGAALNVKNVFGVDLLALARSKRCMSEVADAIESGRREILGVSF